MQAVRREDIAAIPDRFRILAPLGKGTWKRVYHAFDTRLKRDVAIAVVDAHESPNTAKEEFLDEASIGAIVSAHPNVVTIHDVIERGACLVVVQQFAGGGDLTEKLAGGALEQDVALGIATDIATALDHTHAHGVCHRDLKPGNVLFDAEGRTLLADFGLSGPMGWLSFEDAPYGGTPAYSAPELFRGGAVLPSSDFYALGCLLFEMLCGRKAFEGASLFADKNAPDLEFPAAVAMPLRRLVSRLVDPIPDNRPQSRGDFERTLRSRSAPADVGVAAGPSSLVGRDEQLAAMLSDPDPSAPTFKVVEGEAGVGKSRLVAEYVAARRRAGFAVIATACEQSDPRPHGALDRALDDFELSDFAPLGEFLNPVGDQELDPDRLLNAAATQLSRLLLESCDVLVIDDLHWLEPSTALVIARVLGELGREPLDRPFEVVMGMRPTEVAPHQAELLRWRYGRLEDVQLTTLSRADVRRWVENRAPHLDTEHIAETLFFSLTNGNPLFMEHVFVQLVSSREAPEPAAGSGAAGVAMLPTSIDECVRWRIGQLAVPVQRTLMFAALIGMDADVDLLAQLLGVDASEVDRRLSQAEQAGLLDRKGAGFQFAHPLVLAACVQRVTPASRELTHLQIALRLVAESFEENTKVMAIAYHLVAAGGRESAADVGRFVRQAAHAAMGVYAFDLSGTYFEAVLESMRLEAADEAQLAEVHRETAALYKRAVRVRCLDTIATTYATAGDPGTAISFGEEALAVAAASDDWELRCVPVTSLALAHLELVELDKAGAYWADSIDLDRSETGIHTGYFLRRLPLPLYFMGRAEEAAEVSRRAHTHCLAIHICGETSIPPAAEALACALQGDLARAHRCIAEAIDLVEESRYSGSAAFLFPAAAWLSSVSGDPDRARECLGYVTEPGRLLDTREALSPTLERCRTLVEAYAGNIAQDSPVELSLPNTLFLQDIANLCLDVELFARGCNVPLHERTEEALAMAKARGAMFCGGWATFLPRIQAELALLGGRHDDARRGYEGALGLATRQGYALELARLELALGRLTEAPDLVQRATESFTEMGAHGLLVNSVRL